MLKTTACLIVLMVSPWRVETVDAAQPAIAQAQEPEKSIPKQPPNPDEVAALKRFQQNLQRAIGRAVSERDYPRVARDHGWEGSTLIRVEFEPDGLVNAVAVARSSGYVVLDDGAVSKARSVTPPDVPDGLRGRRFSVDVPFRFSLRKREVLSRRKERP